MEMRRFLTLFVILFAVALHPVYAQGGMGGGMGGMGGGMGGMRGGMSGGPGQGQGMQERVQLTPEDIVTSLGLFVISPEPIIKKCKLKDEATIDKLGSVLAEYSREFDNISFEFAPQLDSITNVEDNKPAMNVQDASSMTSMQQEMRNRMAMVRKIRERATAMHKKLQEDIKVVFDEKQLKRWESYYAELCSENYFSTQERGSRGGGSGERPERSSGGMNGGGMGDMGGMGGMGDMGGDMGGF